MEKYIVTGMSCAACAARVEKAVNAVEGVDGCAVSFLTNSMGVEGPAKPEEIIRAVEAAGYGARQEKTAGKDSDLGDLEDSLADTQTPKMKKRLIASLILLIPLVYVSMGHMLWNWPVIPIFKDNYVAVGIYELLLSAMIMVINQKFFINGFKGLFCGSPNMDTLVALGAAASFSYSVFSLFAMSEAVRTGDFEKISYYMNQYYFESAAMILTLITVGKMLEAKSKGRTTDALKSLMKLKPKTAVILDGSLEKTVDIDDIKVGDKFVVRPGENIPVDGIVISGESAVNEASLTGESIPADKKAGDAVSAATTNTSGYIVCEATRVGEDTTLSEIIKMVSDAAATKAPIAKIADRVSGVFVPVVIGIALVTLIAWLLAGQAVGYAIARAVSVLVISCPCALGLATPVAIMVGNGAAAKSGILFKTSTSLEQAGKTKIIAFDKTGTITTGIMQVTDIVLETDLSEEEVLSQVYALEAKSEHPISKAIVDYAKSKDLRLYDAEDFEAVSGNGLKGNVRGRAAACGNAAYISGFTGKIPDKTEELIKKFSSEGKTPVLFAQDGKITCLIAVCDTIKDDSRKAIEELKNMGIHTVMITGDNKITGEAIAVSAGVDEFAADVKPDGKEAVIKELKAYGPVIMVGDGINDAPALTAADLGIAIGAGTDVAIDAADVVLMKGSLRDVAAAIRISRATLRNIHENLFWAFFYNAVCIPVAAGCYAAFGLTLNPMLAAAAMGLSSFCVVSNALRLNLVKIYDTKRDNRIKNPVTGDLIIKDEFIEKGKDVNDMEMTVRVKGMMCAHCEAHVKKALEVIDGVESAAPSHETGTVELKMTKDVEEAVIKAAVEEAGYEYEGK